MKSIVAANYTLKKFYNRLDNVLVNLL